MSAIMRRNKWLCYAVAVVMLLAAAFILPFVTGTAEEAYASVTDPTSGLVYEVKTGDYGYGAYITGYNGTGSEVTIPATLGGAPVVSVRLNDEGLTSLDVSNSAPLVHLGCDENNLSALNVSNNAALTELHCSDNNLSALDVSKNTALAYLTCQGNNLSALDVSGNSVLTELFCGSNKLSVLDVSENTALGALWCNNNNLRALDVSKNTALTYLYCPSNSLSTFDVSNNALLSYFDCRNNYITDSSARTALIDRFGSESVLPQRTPHQFFDVTFNANGGTVSPVSAQSGVDGKLESLPTPTRDGYRFDGWFTALSGGTQVTTDTVFGANTTIYAQWTYTGGGPFIALQSISLNKTTLTLSPGGSAALTVVYDPANTTENPAAAWTSSNPNVATVAGGVVTAKAAGEATVTASVTAANGTKIATCKVSVTPGGEPFTQTPVAHDKIPAAKTPTAPGGSSKLPMTITFPDGKSANVTWTVGAAGDTGKASVDSKGNVTGVSEGKVTLVAKATDGSGKTHKVTIIIAKDVTKVRTPLAKIYLAKGKAWTPAVCADSVNPKTKEADTSAKLTWKSSNPAVAAVNETTGKITPKKPGKATITATSLNGKSKLTIAVTVATKATALKKFALSGAPKSLKAGKTAQLKLKLTPSKATNPAVKFKSSAPKVVSVDKTGKLTALKKGKAKITVTAGKKKVTKTVTVK